MAKVKGIDKVQKALKALDQKTGKSASVIVGYTQEYAIHVHENLEAYHPVGQAKYLEQPARELSSELGQLVKTLMRQGVAMVTALLLAGLRLQRASQELVPVDTGALKNSAFTKVQE